MTEKYIEFLKPLVLRNQETSSFESYIPLITIVGAIVFFYYGYRGIVKKKTISLFKHRGFSASESHELSGDLTGTSAVVFGIIYILLGLLLLFVTLKIF